VFDKGFPLPLAGAAIRLQDEEYHTDTNGFISVKNLRTGAWPVQLVMAGYLTAADQIDIKLNGNVDTLFMTRQNSVPVIAQFYCAPSATNARDDTVNCFISAHDSSGGISMVYVDLGNGKYDSLQFNPPQPSISQTIKNQYDSPGDYFVIVKVYGNLNDSACTQNQRVTIANNSRPCTTGLRIDRFFAGVDGYIQVGATDADNNFSRHEINWGDSTAGVEYHESAVLWHKYDIDNDSLFDISISLFDKSGAVWRMDTNVLVTKLNPPNLNQSLQYLPYQILGPTDDSVTISVQVRSADEYIASIIWRLNEGSGSAELYASQSYDETSGQVANPPVLFSYTFPTDSLSGENVVHIFVYDNHGYCSEVWGSFSIAGR
jgi:hypothetical protein